MVSRPSCPALEQGRARGGGARLPGCRQAAPRRRLSTDRLGGQLRSLQQPEAGVRFPRADSPAGTRRAPVSTAPAAARGLALTKGGGLVLCPAAEISDGQHRAARCRRDGGNGRGGRCGACLRAPSDQPTMPRHSIQTTARASRDDDRVVAQCAPTGAGVGIALCARGACQKKARVAKAEYGHTSQPGWCNNLAVSTWQWSYSICPGHCATPWRRGQAAAVLQKIPHSNSCKSVPNSLAFRTGCSQSVVMHTYT